VDAGDLDTLLGTLTNGVRKRYQIALSANDDFTFNYEVEEVTLAEAADTATLHNEAVTGHGVGQYFACGRNADAGDLDTLLHGLSNAVGKQYSIDISPNDDGTFNYSVRELTNFVFASADLGAGNRKLRFGKNTTIPVLAAGERLAGGSVDLQDDGGYGFSLMVKDTAAPTSATAATGGVSKAITLTTKSGDLPASVPTPGAGAQGTIQDVDVVLDDDGTARWAQRTIVSSPLEIVSLAFNSDIMGIANVSVVVTAKINQIVAPATNVYTAGVSREISGLRINDDGTYDWIEILSTIGIPVAVSAVTVESELVHQVDHIALRTKFSFYSNKVRRIIQKATRYFTRTTDMTLSITLPTCGTANDATGSEKYWIQKAEALPLWALMHQTIAWNTGSGDWTFESPVGAELPDGDVCLKPLDR
jgi:hypothetical protein